MIALAEPGGAVAAHGDVTVEHHPLHNEVRILAHGTWVWLSDSEARDLAYALAELFPSMVREVGR